MLKKVNIGSKITALVSLITALSVFAICLIAFSIAKRAVEDQFVEKLSVITSYKKEKTEKFFHQLNSELTVVKESFESSFSSPPFLPSIAKPADLNDNNQVVSHLPIGPEIIGQIDRIISRNPSIQQIWLLDSRGTILYHSDSSNVSLPAGKTFYDPDGQTLNRVSQGPYVSRICKDRSNFFAFVGLPTTDQNTLIIAKVDVNDLFLSVVDKIGLGKTGESFLVSLDRDKITYLNSSRITENAPLAIHSKLGSGDQRAVQRAVQKTKGFLYDVDYRKEATLAIWDYMPELGWGIVSKIDISEIDTHISALKWKFVLAGFIVLMVASTISIVFSRILTDALLSLKNSLQMLSEGVLPQQVEKRSDDEIGQMALTTGKLVKALQSTATFAHQIGAGKLEASFEPLSEKDTLGNALINMRDSIRNAEKRDTERNWIVTGVAEIGEILRSHNQLEELGDAVVAYVCRKINAIQGAFYVVNEDSQESLIEMKASYAYHKKKYLKNTFKFAEGLVGQAAIEQDTLLRTEIPYDYVSITSGLLGDQRPTSLLIVPLITNEKVYGVLEFAGFEKFSGRDVRFVEEISLITARTVFNIKVNERTHKLLEESQQMSNELQEQQEILRQNAEEMQATQEELQRANKQLEEQIQEVERTQNRMASLLENASEVVTIYEENAAIRYISPSVERIFGYTQEEMIGKSDIEFIQGEGKDVFGQMFSSLLGNSAESLTVQYVYKNKNQGEVWVEATGTNLLNDPAVQGIVLNSRDITERKRAEQEERMRSKMQALSENSPDLITRLDKEGTFFYINPTIETYTGLSPNEFLNKTVAESNFDSSVVDEWLKILEEVNTSEQKVAREIDFPSKVGDRVMHVNAIPEFDEEEHLESVLVVSHDITDRKQIEIEIQSKNKKINDSINYARRIQGAILPDNHIINQVFPESFIFYRAKDVVSGDFPWFLQRGEDIFIAAVDCTGHGVPGALISLIGYFLLNDIVRSRGVTDPGEILDQLDEGVTETLRQDSSDSQSKDGMDISLCLIRKNEVQYAGAHRPLYHIHRGEMTEIKGNKFPIGGGIFKNQTNFTNHKIKVAKGDSIYFCSDGFPDQFGGPDNRKYGPKRLRALIQDNHHKPMGEVHQSMMQSWNDWRGQEKQTDDVLMIGIKF